MVKNNEYIIPKRVEKPVETVYEIKDYEIKKSPLSPSARNKVINKSGSNFRSENQEGYGPMLVRAENNTIFELKCCAGEKKEASSGGERTWRAFFEKSGEYFTIWRIKGNLTEIKREYWDLREGKIRVVLLNSQGNYEEYKKMKERIRDDLEERIRKIELAIENREMIDNKEELTMIPIEYTRNYDCPKQPLERRYHSN